jgi:hypothetical protein
MIALHRGQDHGDLVADPSDELLDELVGQRVVAAHDQMRTLPTPLPLDSHKPARILCLPLGQA